MDVLALHSRVVPALLWELRLVNRPIQDVGRILTTKVCACIWNWLNWILKKGLESDRMSKGCRMEEQRKRETKRWRIGSISMLHKRVESIYLRFPHFLAAIRDFRATANLPLMQRRLHRRPRSVYQLGHGDSISLARWMRRQRAADTCWRER